uniref:Putative secreted peptide n=1 Tax=Anopheles braziliensis TaxID=58242 RepID=A0A2M3ZTB3_9DIPT
MFSWPGWSAAVFFFCLLLVLTEIENRPTSSASSLGLTLQDQGRVRWARFLLFHICRAAATVHHEQCCGAILLRIARTTSLFGDWNFSKLRLKIARRHVGASD